MSELYDYIASAQSRLADAESAISDVESELRAAQDLAENNNGLDVNDLIAAVEDALRDLSRAEDNIPTRYTEVGDVESASDDALSNLSDAQNTLSNVLDSLRDAQ